MKHPVSMRSDIPDTSNLAIGRRLVAVREARGLTQATMARAMEMTAQRWGGYERGRTVPPPATLARFWQLTGATADFILFGNMAGLPMALAQLLRTPAPPDAHSPDQAAG